MRYLILAASALLVSASAQAAAPNQWDVTCYLAGTPKTWANVSEPANRAGGMTFTAADGSQVVTTAGLNCYAVKAPAKVG
jgi:hypothetical protein